MHILVAEDDELLANAVGDGLRDQDLVVDIVHDGASALDRCRRTEYDVLVLDRGLPLVHGDQVCRSLATGQSATKILMLTAAAEVADRVSGLERGADDYLPKPFVFAELVARVYALGRRSRTMVPPVLVRAGITLDPARHLVVRDGRQVLLTKKEFTVLEELLRANGAVVSAEELLERAWDEKADPFTNAVRVTMAGLRRKLAEPQVIETVPGVGYRIS
ncbi:response regulator transcription factor [Amycolatopsis jejuensis]|uniref:response regulator transcription factor n=1 Tax=Amycolatopsis jejuensis TaxID=330084 RepID=UPI000527ED2D|nr:response regulator transcription factor [Amycolatopsis jejuensis]